MPQFQNESLFKTFPMKMCRICIKLTRGRNTFLYINDFAPSRLSSSFIYLQNTLKILLGLLANNEALIAASQTVHCQMNITYNDNNNVLRGKLENKNMDRKKLDLTYSS